MGGVDLFKMWNEYQNRNLPIGPPMSETTNKSAKCETPKTAQDLFRVWGRPYIWEVMSDLERDRWEGLFVKIQQLIFSTRQQAYRECAEICDNERGEAFVHIETCLRLRDKIAATGYKLKE